MDDGCVGIMAWMCGCKMRMATEYGRMGVWVQGVNHAIDKERWMCGCKMRLDTT